MNKAFWAILSILGDCREKFTVSVPHSLQDWWKSSQPARCTYNLQPDLLGSIPADVSPDITLNLPMKNRYFEEQIHWVPLFINN